MLVYSVEEAIWFPESKKNRNKAVVHRITSQIKGCVLGWYKVALCTLFVQHCSENQQLLSCLLLLLGICSVSDISVCLAKAGIVQGKFLSELS